MSENLFLSYLNNIDWSVAFQWYLNYLDAGYLIWTWEQGKVFSYNDWVSVMLLMVNFLVLLSLVNLFIKKHRESQFRTWFEDKRSRLISRPAR